MCLTLRTRCCIWCMHSVIKMRFWLHTFPLLLDVIFMCTCTQCFLLVRHTWTKKVTVRFICIKPGDVQNAVIVILWCYYHTHSVSLCSYLWWITQTEAGSSPSRCMKEESDRSRSLCSSRQPLNAFTMLCPLANVISVIRHRFCDASHFAQTLSPNSHLFL